MRATNRESGTALGEAEPAPRAIAAAAAPAPTRTLGTDAAARRILVLRTRRPQRSEPAEPDRLRRRTTSSETALRARCRRGDGLGRGHVRGRRAAVGAEAARE